MNEWQNSGKTGLSQYMYSLDNNSHTHILTNTKSIQPASKQASKQATYTFNQQKAINRFTQLRNKQYQPKRQQKESHKSAKTKKCSTMKRHIFIQQQQQHLGPKEMNNHKEENQRKRREETKPRKAKAERQKAPT
jgi:hypothetical protein